MKKETSIMEAELLKYIDYRFYSGLAIAIGLVIAAIGGYYFREFNNKVSSIRHDLVTTNQNNLSSQIGTSTDKIIEEQEKKKSEIQGSIKTSTTDLRKEIEKSESKITSGQESIKNQLNEANKSEVEKRKNLVMATVNDGSRIVTDIKEFKIAGKTSGDAHIKRAKSWQQFKKSNNLESRDISIEVSNYSSDPILDVNLKVIWNLPTYKVEPSFGGDHTKFRVFSTFFYQKTEDYKESIEPPEWSLVRYKDELVKISKIESNQSINVILRRITDKTFLKKPKLILNYKDVTGSLIEK